MSAKRRKPPRVAVDWLDACLVSEETKPDDFAALKLAARTTEGRLIHENEQRILVASTHDGDGHADGIWVIPRVLVTAMRVVGQRRRKPKVGDGEAPPKA